MKQRRTANPDWRRRGQSLIEFALVYGLVLLPLSFMLVFGCQMLWMWHSVGEWTRAGAKYAATHCYVADAANVKQWMRENVPPMVDQDRFIQGEVDLQVEYFRSELGSGLPVPFQCDGAECSRDCVPDQVRVSVAGYQFRRMLDVLGLPPVVLPDFRATTAMEGAGCSAGELTCRP